MMHRPLSSCRAAVCLAAALGVLLLLFLSWSSHDAENDVHGVMKDHVATTSGRHPPPPLQPNSNTMTMMPPPVENQHMTSRPKVVLGATSSSSSIAVPRGASSSCTPDEMLVDPSRSAVRFQQVRSFPGATDLSLIEKAMRRLSKVHGYHDPNDTNDHRVNLFAADGTLLNLLRWGRVVNDNDIDVGFFISPSSKPTTEAEDEAPHLSVRERYNVLHKALADVGFIEPLTERTTKRLYNSHKVVKPGRCQLRQQMMQCRDIETGVIVDIFGTETTLSRLTGLTLREDIVPLRRCAAFGATFPCPNRPLKALKFFTMNFGPSSSSSTSSSAAPSTTATWYEFAGCSLFPRRTSEQTRAHLDQIIAAGRELRRCGFPTMMEDLESKDCRALLQLR